MNINWAEILIGGTIFFVLGSVFSIFFQPSLQTRLERRREGIVARREQQDAKFAAEVRGLAGDTNLYAAVFRAEVAEALVSVLRALLLVVVAFAADYLFYMAGLLFFAGALASLIPISSSARRLRQMSVAVRDHLELI